MARPLPPIANIQRRNLYRRLVNEILIRFISLISDCVTGSNWRILVGRLRAVYTSNSAFGLKCSSNMRMIWSLFTPAASALKVVRMRCLKTGKAQCCTSPVVAW